MASGTQSPQDIANVCRVDIFVDHDDERHSEQHQRQQGAKPGGREGGDDCERMDRTFVEHAEDDIDRDQRSHDQDGRAAERALERLRVALEAGGDRRRQVEIGRRPVETTSITGLGSVEIHREFITAAARRMFAAKL